MVIDYDASFELYNKGKNEMKSGCNSEAIECLEESIAIYPHFKTLELLGENLLTVGKPLEAIIYLAASVTLGQNQFRGLYLLSKSLQQIGKTDEAVRFLQEALKLNPHYKLAQQFLESIQGTP